MKYIYLSFLLFLPLAPSLAANSYSKCKVVISKIGSPDITTCNSVLLIEKCFTESPGEPKLCSLTGKLPLENRAIKISAEILNGFLSLWIDAGDSKWMVNKVTQQALIAPLYFNLLIPVRNSSQMTTEEKAFITCSVYQEEDSNRNCD